MAERPDGDLFVREPVGPSNHPLVWNLEDVQAGKPSDWSKARDPQWFSLEEVEAHFARAHERRMARKTIEQRRLLPPLLNDRAVHTRAATYGDKYDQFFHSPSSRIGANYSQQSAWAGGELLEVFPQDPSVPRTAVAPIIMPPRTMKLGSIRSPHAGSGSLHASVPLGATGATDGPLSPPAVKLSPPAPAANGAHKRAAPEGGEAAAAPKAPRTAANPLGGAPEGELVDAVLKYFFYVEHGVDMRHIAPYRQEWLHAALAMVPGEAPPGVDAAYYDAFMQASIEEVHEEYCAAVKKSMIDYVLRNPLERKRLGLQALEPLLARPSVAEEARAATYRRHLPRWWHHDVTSAAQEAAAKVQHLSPHALELSRQWEEGGFDACTLIDLSLIHI